MVKITRIFGNCKQHFEIIELPSEDNRFDSYLINKLNSSQNVEIDPFQKETINNLFVKTVDYSNEKDFNYFMLYHTDKIFYYIFNGELFEIKGAKQVILLDHFLFSEKRMILVAVSNTYIYLYKFYSDESATSNYCIFYNSLPKSCILTDSTTEFIFHNDTHYYITPISVMKNNQKALFVKFNFDSFENFTAPMDSVVIDHTHKSVCILTPNGIFKLPEFRFYNARNLFNFLGKKRSNLYYKLFTTNNNRSFLFISKENVHFSRFELPSSVEYKNGIFVDGLLYDLDNKRFVAPTIKSTNSNLKWFTFFLYDSGVPHVYKINSEKEDKNKFAILYLNKKNDAFSKIICHGLPTFVSHLSIDFNIPHKRHNFNYKRIIFYKKDFKEANNDNLPSVEDCIVVINGNLEISYTDDYILFESVVFSTNQYNSAKSRFICLQYANVISPLIVEKSSSFGTSEDIIQSTESHIFHLFNNDSIIIKSQKGEFGELILVFLNQDFEINYSLSFFHFRKLKHTKQTKTDSTNFTVKPENYEYYLETISRKNDFENMIHIINLKTHCVVVSFTE